MTLPDPSPAHDPAKWRAARGRPSAVKRGRNPLFPYVPRIVYPDGRTRQILRVAFATRSEALAHAENYLERQATLEAIQLATPRYRALRRSRGLPEELPR